MSRVVDNIVHMEECNLFCDQPQCSQPAVQFGFAQGTTKTKVCATHVSLLQQTDVYSISALHFISSVEDGMLYEHRRVLTQKGQQNISVLEQQCAGDLQTALNCLQHSKARVNAVVDRSFQEMELLVQSRYAEIQQELDKLRVTFEKFTQEKQSQLSLSDSALCGEMPTASLFRLVLGDCTLLIAETLMSKFFLLPYRESDRTGLFARSSLGKLKAFAQEQTEQGNPDVAKATEKYMQELGDQDFISNTEQTEEKRKRKSARRLLALLPRTAADVDVQEVAEQYAKASAAARGTGNYELALRKAQKGRTWAQQLGRESPAICLELGLGLTHLAEWQEADSVLKQGLDTSDSELAIQVSNALAENYLQAGQCVEAKAMCEWTLSTWESSGYHFELLRALCMLYCSVIGYGELDNAGALKNRRNTQIVADSPRSECLLQFISIYELVLDEADRDELKCYIEETLLMAERLLPYSYLTLFLRNFLITSCGFSSDDERQANEQCRHIYNTCRVHYPRSIELIFSLIAFVNDDTSIDIAEPNLLQALQILTDYIPMQPLILPEDYEDCTNEYLPIVIRINCLRILAEHYTEAERFQEAEAQLATLKEVFAAHCPASSHFAGCVEKMGKLYRRKGQLEDAAQKYEEARVLYIELDREYEAERCEQAIRSLGS